MIIKAIFLGGLFGMALYFIGAHLPSRITGMLQLKDFRLMKGILFAIGLSSFLIALTNSMGLFNISHFSVKPMNLAVIVGGIIFGLGFGMGAACPGTCVAGIGGGAMLKGSFALLGGLLGAFIFSKVYYIFVKMGLYRNINYGRITLFKISEKFPAILDIGIEGLYISGIIFMAIVFFIPDYRSS